MGRTGLCIITLTAAAAPLAASAAKEAHPGRFDAKIGPSGFSVADGAVRTKRNRCAAFVCVPLLSPSATPWQRVQRAGKIQWPLFPVSVADANETGGRLVTPSVASRVPRGGAVLGLSSPTSFLPEITNAQASAVAKRLYPLSTLPILLQTYLMTREEAVCPRGAAVGLMAQTASVLLAVPIVARVRFLRPNMSFIEIDWLHWVEAAMLHISMQATAMSFRQAARASQQKRPLPASATRYMPMAKIIVALFLLVALVGLGHLYSAGGDSWEKVAFLNGMLEPPTPGRHSALKGALSFPVWISHWSMLFDFSSQLRYMWKWGDLTGKEQWKDFVRLHLPYCIVNGAVIINHLHRDKVAALRLVHPIFVFIGGISLLIGAVRIVQANGSDTAHASDERGISLVKTNKFSEDVAFPDWDLKYTAISFAVGALLSYASLYLSV